MRYILAILGVLFLCSCECGTKHRWTEEQVRIVMHKSIAQGRAEVLDSIAKLEPIEVTSEPTSKVDSVSIQYYGSDFDLPSGKVVDFSPNDNWITEHPDEQIYIHIEDEFGVRKIYPTSYKVWLGVREGDVLL